MALHLPLLMKDHVVGKRSAVTCALKCDNQCMNPACNTSDNAYFGDIARAAISRRSLIGGAAAGALVIAVGGTQGTGEAALAVDPAAPNTAIGSAPEAPGGSPMRFTPIAPVDAKVDELNVPAGYVWKPIIRWGDPLFANSPEFDWKNQTPESQALQFGFNNDYTEIQEVPGNEDTRAVMFVNHEYTNSNTMFPATMPEEQQVAITMAAQGLSVVELERKDRQSPYTYIKGAPLNRRFLLTTAYELTGPAAGSDLVKTKDDPDGRTIKGTFANCSGGLTPWGTLLAGEENFHGYFKADPAKPGNKRLGLTTKETTYKWDLIDPRFNTLNPGYENEVNRFGYVIEVDPWDPTSTPKKHSALGRFKHEGANVIIAEDGRAVAYMGDDERFEYIYKFVSTNKYIQGDRKHNMTLLSEGSLYVARFTGNSPKSEITGTGAVPKDGNFDGTGEWLPLIIDGKSVVSGMSAAEVAVNTRLAADKVQPTKMDRPEDVQPSLKSRKMYAALTNNDKRAKDATYPGVDEVNPRSVNRNGQILELDELGDQTSTTFAWNLLIVCGDPKKQKTFYAGFPASKVSPISCPDNLAFDSAGNLWIATDGAPSSIGYNDGLFRVTLEGPNRGNVEQFLSVPRDAETCGPIVRDNDFTAFVSVQHPGEEGTFAEPHSYFPDYNGTGPRPTVVQVLPKWDVKPVAATPSATPSAPVTTVAPTSAPATTAAPTTTAAPAPAVTTSAAPAPAPVKSSAAPAPVKSSAAPAVAKSTAPAAKSSKGSLPRTGAEVAPVVAGAAALLAAGGVLAAKAAQNKGEAQGEISE